MRELIRRFRSRKTNRDVLKLSRENRRLSDQAESDAERIVELMQQLDHAKHANIEAARRIVMLTAELEAMKHQLSARDVMLEEAEREIEALRGSIDRSVEAFRRRLAVS